MSIYPESRVCHYTRPRLISIKNYPSPSFPFALSLLLHHSSCMCRSPSSKISWKFCSILVSLTWILSEAATVQGITESESSFWTDLLVCRQGLKASGKNKRVKSALIRSSKSPRSVARGFLNLRGFKFSPRKLNFKPEIDLWRLVKFCGSVGMVECC